MKNIDHTLKSDILELSDYLAKEYQVEIDKEITKNIINIEERYKDYLVVDESPYVSFPPLLNSGYIYAPYIPIVYTHLHIKLEQKIFIFYDEGEYILDIFWDKDGIPYSGLCAGYTSQITRNTDIRFRHIKLYWNSKKEFHSFYVPIGQTSGYINEELLAMRELNPDLELFKNLKKVE